MKFDPNSRFGQALPAFLPAFAAILIYAVTLGGGYVYDDLMVVHDDIRLHDPHQWVRYWTTDYFDGGIDNLYRPLISTSYAVEWWLHGDRPWIFHAINILLHALAAASVGELVRRITRRILPAITAGMLFAIHPVHTEAVANIVGRAELACTCAILIALILLCVQPLTVTRILLTIAIGVIGLLCKEQGILQPLLWLLFCALLVRPRPASAVKILTLLTCWIWAIYLIWREHILKFEWDRTYMDPTVQPLIRSIGIDRMLMPFVLLGHYIALLLWPAHLAVDYGADAIGSIVRMNDPCLWIGFATAASLCLGIAYCWFNRRRFTLFCLLSFCITYGVIGNILTLIGTNFAERLIYLPSVFALIIAALFLNKLPDKLATAILVFLVSAGSIRTFIAARNWNHPVQLFESGLLAQPKSIQLHFLLAQALHNQGDATGATNVLTQACDLYPRYWRVWVYRAMEEMNDGNFAQAHLHLQRAMDLQKHPQEIAALSHLQDLESASTKPSAKQSVTPPLQR